MPLNTMGCYTQANGNGLVIVLSCGNYTQWKSQAFHLYILLRNTNYNDEKGGQQLPGHGRVQRIADRITITKFGG